MKVPGFLTIELIDIIVDSVIGSLFCMTEDEAGSCSIFFNEIWKSVNSWRYDNDAFASELKDTVRPMLFPTRLLMYPVLSANNASLVNLHISLALESRLHLQKTMDLMTMLRLLA
jgi:hypothetical protein